MMLDDYRNGIFSAWQHKPFVDTTHYTAEKNDNQTCIRSRSNSAPSVLFYKTEIDPREFSESVTLLNSNPFNLLRGYRRTWVSVADAT
jgi:hypothetical protein